MKKVVILNVYGHENIGDGAILDESLRLIAESYGEEVELNIHTSNPGSIRLVSNKKNDINSFLNPYGIAIKYSGRSSDLKKIIILVKIIIKTYLHVWLDKLNVISLPIKGDYSYIYSIKTSNKVLSSGGGYLRTKSRFRDLFGFILVILSIQVAHAYGKKITFLPISYGNFASGFHEFIAYHHIKRDKLFLRDQFSINMLGKKLKNNIIFFPDLALFGKSYHSQSQKNYIVITARKWLDNEMQEKYEKSIAELIDYVWEKYKLKSIFIPMVWNKMEEDDSNVAINIEKYLKYPQAFKIVSVNLPRDVKKIISESRFAVCTRMHSVIFSVIENTGFIAISYEEKTKSFLELMNAKEFCIDINEVNKDILIEKFDFLVENWKKSYEKKIINEFEYIKSHFNFNDLKINLI